MDHSTAKKGAGDIACRECAAAGEHGVTDHLAVHTLQDRLAPGREGRGPVQRLRAAAGQQGISTAEFDKSLRYTVYLTWTYTDGVNTFSGFAQSTTGSHAEDNMLSSLRAANGGALPTAGSLEVHLSASPCSSIFGTTKKGTGCSEELEDLQDSGVSVNVHADHLYQPTHIMSAKEASMVAASTARYAIDFSKLSGPSKDVLSLYNKDVIQLLPRLVSAG